MNTSNIGAWLGHWSYTHGRQEGHDFGLGHRHDLHACWWILCTGNMLLS